MSSKAEFAFLYVTFPDRETAMRIGRDAVERKLAACMNLFAPHDSIYRWKGAVESSREYAALFKTTAEASEQLMKHIRTMHPYQTPCIVLMAPDQVEAAFGAWIRESVNPA